MDKLRRRWSALKGWQRWTALGVGVLVILAIIGAAIPTEDEPSTPFSDEEARALIEEATRDRTATAPVETTPSEPTPAERAEAERQRRLEAARERRAAQQRARARARERAREQARRERLLRGTLVEGSGARVVTVNLDRDAPLLVEASHRGGGNFIVELVGNGVDDLLVNEIGSYSGSVLSDDVVFSGRYRIRVEADGGWSLRYRQPQPLGGEPSLLRTFRGAGSQVVPVQTPDDLEPIITARNSGGSNFIVQLVGYGDEVSGSELLFNEIGPYQGETLTSIPSGDFLLAVEAEGPWTVRFQR